MNRLLHNEDCTQVFWYGKLPEGGAGAHIDRYYDVLAGAGVTELFCNTNARRTNYKSEVWESFFDGYDPKGPDDQPALQGVSGEDSMACYRAGVGNMQAVHREGIDYPARVISRCRHHGIVPWISIRMNDVHHTGEPEHPFHGTFWKRNPNLRRQGANDWFRSAFDYAHQEVRDYFKALIEESLTRYDMDGLELDFMREPYLFSVGKEAEGGKILTAWIREIRGLVEAAAGRHGHPVKLGVRVPSHIETAQGLGLDAVAWAKEGLVDLVVPANRWATIEFDMPLARWREALAGWSGTLAGGMDVSVSASPGATMRCALHETEYARGAAMSILKGGADAVYLFNYFQPGKDGDVRGYQELMKSLASPEALARLPRRHAVTWREIRAPGENFPNPLPASGKAFAFELPLGPRPDPEMSVHVLLEAVKAPGMEKPGPIVSLNGRTCRLCASTAENDRQQLMFEASPAAVSGDNTDVVEIRAGTGREIKILGVEARVGMMKVKHRWRKLQEALGAPQAPDWWYTAWIPFQISPTELAVPLNRLATGIYTVDFGLGADMAVIDGLDAPAKAIVPAGRTAFERHPRTGKPVQMTRWAPHGGFVPLGAKRADGSPHPHAGTGFGVGTVLAFPCDGAGNLTTRLYCDTDDVYFSQDVVQLRYDGATLGIEHSERVEPERFIPGYRLNGSGLGLAVPDGDDFLFGCGCQADKPDNAQCGVARWRRLDGRWRMTEFVPVATEPGVYYSEATMARDADGSLLFCARANSRFSIELWRSADGGRTWTRLLAADNIRQLTPISINTTGDGRAYVAANPYCPGNRDSRGIERYANALRERILMWPLSDDRKRLLEPVVFRDTVADFGIPPSGMIWAADHPMSTTARLADGKWHHLVSYRLLDLAEILEKGPQTPETGTRIDELELTAEVMPPWRF